MRSFLDRRSAEGQAGAAALLLALACACPTAPAAVPAAPSYRHLVVIIEENKAFEQIIGADAVAPNLNRLAREYGLATHYDAVAHPSEPNYVALLGGDTFGISDDDAYDCKPGQRARWCPNAARAGYPDHTLEAPSLLDQLAERHLSWKAYLESLPSPGSDAVAWPEPGHPVPGMPDYLYAAKHNGFMNFRSVQDDAGRARKILGFDALERDLDAGELPAYAQIIPNQCNDMHGLGGSADVPEDCHAWNTAALIRRGDALAGSLVARLMQSSAWKAPENMAIVITFDEDDGRGASAGTDALPLRGGRVATIVITNHGPRGIADASAYSHYSLLRTTEALLGLATSVGHAADPGVASMDRLFATGP